MDVETGDKVGRASGGVEASISESADSDVTRPSNSRLTVGVADSLAGKVDQFFRPGTTTGASDRGPGLVAATGGSNLELRSERSGILPQDDIDGREVSRRYETDSDTTKFRLRAPSEPVPIKSSCETHEERYKWFEQTIQGCVGNICCSLFKVLDSLLKRGRQQHCLG